MNENKIHFIYLSPSDLPMMEDPTPKYIEQAAKHMRAFCRWQMGNNKTFNWDFYAYKTNHPASWYSQFDQGGIPYTERYWANAQLDARDFAGAQFYMEHDSWVIYLNAFCDEEHGQHAGGASVNGSGICVLHQKDCVAITGKDKDWPLCRAIGGGLHETLHTLGVPHPEPGPDWERAVMGVGYWRYPNAILTENDKWLLDHHRFFAVEGPRIKPPVCPFEDTRPRPKPRKYPTPSVRPVPQH